GRASRPAGGPASRVGLRLWRLGGTLAVTELVAPPDETAVGRVTRRRRGAHPPRRVLVLAVAPVLPRQTLGPSLIVDQQLLLRVDRVLSIREAELEQLGLGDRLGGARFDAEVAVDAPQVVDLVDEAEPFPGRGGVVGIVVGAAHVDALGGADTRTQLAPDALLHSV